MPSARADPSHPREIQALWLQSDGYKERFHVKNTHYVVKFCFAGKKIVLIKQLRPMTMETPCCKKSFIFKDTRKKISVPLTISTNVEKNNFQTSPELKKNTEKKNPGQMLGQDRPEKNSAKCSFHSKRRDSESSTDIDKTSDCAMKAERGALVRGSDPPSGHSVHETAGDTWRAPARRLIQTHLGVAV